MRTGIGPELDNMSTRKCVEWIPSFVNTSELSFRRTLNGRTKSILDSEEGRSSSYWKLVNLFHKQLEGLRLGWLIRAENENTQVPRDFHILLTFTQTLETIFTITNSSRTKVNRKSILLFLHVWCLLRIHVMIS